MASDVAIMYSLSASRYHSSMSSWTRLKFVVVVNAVSRSTYIEVVNISLGNSHSRDQNHSQIDLVYVPLQ